MDALSVLEISSFVATCCFGIINATLKTKNAEGKLTRWGKLSVSGILITTTLSITMNRIKYERDADSRAKAAEKEIAEGKKREEQYERNIQYQKDILDKTQAALNAQDTIRMGTEKALAGIDTSLRLQGFIRNQTFQTLLSTNEVYASTKEINAQQKNVLGNTMRVLYPLAPFTVYTHYEIPFSSPSVKQYIDTLLLVKKQIEAGPKTEFYNDVMVFWADDGKTVTSLSINNSSSLMPGGKNDILLTYPSIDLKLYTRNPIYGPTSDSLSYPDLSFSCDLNNDKNHYGAIRSYKAVRISFTEQKIFLEAYYDNAEVNIGATGKITSVPDLENAYVWAHPLAHNDSYVLTTVILYTGINVAKPIRISFRESERLIPFFEAGSKTYLHRITSEELKKQF